MENVEEETRVMEDHLDDVFDTNEKRIIVLPFTGSMADQTIFKYYVGKVMRSSDEIILAHILKLKDRLEWKESQKKLLVSVSPFMEECKRRLLHYQCIFHSGAVGEGLCELLAEHKPDLIIIGSRGANKLPMKLQTSVGEYVIRNSDTPVLVVPQKY